MAKRQCFKCHTTMKKVSYFRWECEASDCNFVWENVRITENTTTPHKE